MSIPQAEIDSLLDEVMILAEDWEELHQMLAEADTPNERDLLYDYLKQVIARLQQMDRKFNRVVFRPIRDGEKVVGEAVWLYNYTYSMYKWFIKRKFPTELISPRCLTIPTDMLTEKELKQFREQARS